MDLIKGAIYKGDTPDTVKVCELDEMGNLRLKVLSNAEYEASLTYRFPSIVAACLVESLTPEAIASCYERHHHEGVECDFAKDDDPNDYSLTILLFGLLVSLCGRYIKQAKLRETDKEYITIIGNIAQLSGLFHWADKPLSFKEVWEKVIKDEGIPADLMWELHGHGNQPYYMGQRRFLDVMSLAFSILDGYEPFFIDKIQTHNLDGYDNLLESAKETVADEILTRACMREVLKQRQAANGSGSAERDISFEL